VTVILLATKNFVKKLIDLIFNDAVGTLLVPATFKQKFSM